jgi:putative ABC transport system ATP-binding protein
LDPNLFRYIWRNSRSEQLFVLGLILCSLPFYWLSLDVPKRIVNEAIQGRAFEAGNTEVTAFEIWLPLPGFLGGSVQLFEGVSLDQLGYLFALSGLFLFFVLMNGAFKYGINISKGILAERMLRRMRFELFNRLMRFKPEHIRAVKPAEAASMIKDEVEPIGGFIGDAFIQPAFLGTQAFTAMLFIMVQSVWLGLVALVVVLIQAFLIPYLRREQLRLGRERQLASRKLAGRIGEMIDGAGTIHTHGLKSLSEAEIGGRLSHLFDIRSRLYKRKFAVKYLNNLLAQITPFFFFSIGGYLALTGSLDIGQLVAVIAAYRDLPPPIKELIDWDQRRADVGIKYEQVISQFSGQPLISDSPPKPVVIGPTVPLVISDLTVNDQRGSPLVSGLSLTINRPSHVAFVGPSSSGRDIAARAIGRQISRYEGTIRLGKRKMADLSDATAARYLTYVPPDPELFAGTIRDNITISLKRRPIVPDDPGMTKWVEAKRTGNPLLDDEGDWTDYEAAGVSGPDELEAQIVALIEDLDLGDDVYGYGLQSPLTDIDDADIRDRIIESRHEVRARLDASGLKSLVAPFEPDAFNPHATVGENLMFGVIAGERLAEEGRASDSFFRAILAAEAIELPLMEIGLRIAETSLEVFRDLPSGHPIFERFSMVKTSELEAFESIQDQLASGLQPQELDAADQSRLLRLAFDYNEARHRLGVMTDDLERRILRARHSFRRYLPSDYEVDIEFYDADKITRAAPLQDNLLFGRIAQNVANADRKIADFLRETLSELGLDPLVYRLGLDFDVGPRGQALFAGQRASISLARSLIRRPEIMVVENALRAFPDPVQTKLIERMRSRLAESTLILTLEELPTASQFNTVVEFDGPRAIVKSDPVEKQGSTPQSLETSE